MAVDESQEASIGWGGEVWLHDGVELYELVEVVSFGLPNEQYDDVEKTHLKSPNKRREFLNGLIASSSIDVVINYRPGSTTDQLILDAKAAGDSRALKLVVPANGAPAIKIETFGTVKGFDRGTVTADAKMEGTISIRIDAEPDQSAI